MEISNDKLREIICHAVNYGVYSERIEPSSVDFYQDGNGFNSMANEYANIVLKLLTIGKQ